MVLGQLILWIFHVFNELQQRRIPPLAWRTLITSSETAGGQKNERVWLFDKCCRSESAPTTQSLRNPIGGLEVVM